MYTRNREGLNVYKRSNYIFNISIIVEKSMYLPRRCIYLEMVRKLAIFFTGLEVLK